MKEVKEEKEKIQADEKEKTQSKEKSTMIRPDFSDLLAHFTADRAPFCADADNPAAKHASKSAYDRLISILETKRIVASRMPWINRYAVCLTECPWTSLIDHSQRYSPYAVGFKKARVFAAGGGPAFYVRADLFEKQKWEDHLYTFVTPFWPEYRAPRFKKTEYLGGKTVDYSQEREWRVPHDMNFEYENIEFVIVKSYEDMAKFPKKLKDEIGREKFIIMDQYEKIESLWPVHKL